MATDLPEELQESVAAYDAANLAWGRYYRYVLRRAPGAPNVEPVRAAFGEAALCVPQSAATEEILAFFDALAAAYQSLELLLEQLPDDLRTGEVLVATAALREAIAPLRPWITGAGPDEQAH